MNLIDENYNRNISSKKIFIACGVGIGVLLIIIIGLLIYVATASGNGASLVVDNSKYSYSKYILTKDDVAYIGIEDLTKMTKNGYSYKRGDKDNEDADKCYITNALESTFFEVNSNKFYKVLEDTAEMEYYSMEKPVIKENGKIYMPLDNVKEAFNVRVVKDNNKYNIMSIAYLESLYNLDKSKNSSYMPDESIVWDSKYLSNRKLLKDGIVIVKDGDEKLGIATVSRTSDKKKVTVSTQKIIDPKYDSIEYLEKYKQLVVETESGKGIVQLKEENDGTFSARTLILPQYRDIKPINEKLYVVSEAGKNEAAKKYGIVNQEGDVVLPSDYEDIGFNMKKFTNNGLTNEYIIYDNLIPVKKNELYGFVNLNGKVVINPEYTELGYVGANSNGNVLVIPDVNGIVVKKDKTYLIISKTGKVLIKDKLTKVYKETVDGKEQYSMVYDGKKYNIADYLKKQEESKVTENKTTTENKPKTEQKDETKTTENKQTSDKN